MEKGVVLFSLLVVSSIQLQAHGEPQLPCYFIFGDSLADDGNNNFLPTLAKANYPPYGVDFPDGPTGRFCNGRTIVDILGFASFSLFQFSLEWFLLNPRSGWAWLPPYFLLLYFYCFFGSPLQIYLCFFFLRYLCLSMNTTIRDVTLNSLTAEMMGFDDYIQPFATANGTEILKGVNYASGGAGILNETGMTGVVTHLLYICLALLLGYIH